MIQLIQYIMEQQGHCNHIEHNGTSALQAAGEGTDTNKHAATLTLGLPGVLHGSFSYLLQDLEGQVIDPHSISAG